MLEVFTHNNTVAATPKIAKNARKLGSCNGVAQFNSGLSTSLGTTMCGGFYPALILLTTLVATGGNLNPETLVVMFFMTSMVALLIPHAPGSDVTLNVALLGMFGLPTSVFEVMFTFMPINEPFNQVINLNGKVLAALITEKFHRRHGYDAHCNGDKCDCISHAPSKKEELTAPVDNMSNLKGVQDE